MGKGEVLEIINRMAEIIGTSGGQIIASYTKLYICKAILWLIASFILIGGGSCLVVLTLKESEFQKDTDDEMLVGMFIVGAILCLIGLLIGSSNIPTLFSPESVAIERLLSQVR